MVDNGDSMRVSAKADYAARAAAELATSVDAPVTADRIAEAQDIPVKFLETILLELKHAGIVRSQRGPVGGYTLARPAEDISLADVIRAVDGPLANVRGDRPENMEYRGAAAPLTDVWIAVRAALREILETTSLADLRDGTLPERVRALADDPEAWVSLGRIRGAGSSAGGAGATQAPAAPAARARAGLSRRSAAPGRRAHLAGAAERQAHGIDRARPLLEGHEAEVGARTRQREGRRRLPLPCLQRLQLDADLGRVTAWPGASWTGVLRVRRRAGRCVDPVHLEHEEQRVAAQPGTAGQGW